VDIAYKYNNFLLKSYRCNLIKFDGGTKRLRDLGRRDIGFGELKNLVINISIYQDTVPCLPAFQ
jgi:hypothetical protein